MFLQPVFQKTFRCERKRHCLPYSLARGITDGLAGQETRFVADANLIISPYLSTYSDSFPPWAAFRITTMASCESHSLVNRRWAAVSFKESSVMALQVGGRLRLSTEASSKRNNNAGMTDTH